MADPRRSRRCDSLRPRRVPAGLADRRPLLLIAVGVLAAIVLVAMVWRLDRSGETSGRRRLVDLDRIVVPATPTEDELETPATDIDRDTMASLREGASVQVADDAGRLAQEYGAARIDPLPDEWISMTRPWARFHPSNGRLIEMTALDGTLRVPDREIESGRLEGDVRIRIFEADAASFPVQDRVPAVEIEAELAEYDAASGRLDSPGRIRVRTADATFQGEDLRVVFAPDGATIERLTVERAIGPIEIRRMAMAGAVDVPAGSGSSTSRTASTPASRSDGDPAASAGQDSARAAGSPGIADRSAVPSEDASVSATEAAWRARGDAPEPGEVERPSPVDPADVYRVVLDRDVVIERRATDARGVISTSRIEGDRLTLLLSLTSGGVDDALAVRDRPAHPAAAFGPSAERRIAGAVMPSRSALVSSVAMSGLPQDESTSDDAELIQVHFAGRLVMTPAADEASTLADADDARLVVEGVDGRGISLHDDRQQAEGEAARLEYRVSTSRVDLIGDDVHPLAIRSPRFTLSGGRFWMDRSASLGGLIGPGSMAFDADGAAAVQAAWRAGEDGIHRGVAMGTISDPILVAIAYSGPAAIDDEPAAADEASAAPPRLEIVWEGGVDLDFREGAADARLQQARFRGDVRVEGDEFRLGSQNLVVDFAASGATDDIDRILATGNARVDRVGEAGTLEATSIDLGLTRAEDGRTIPRELIAQGGVAASDPSQTLWTDRLVVRFRPAPATKAAQTAQAGEAREAAPSGRGLAGGLAPEASVGDVEIHTVLATDGVQVRLDEGARVFADRLDGDASAGTLELQGGDVMIVRGNVVADRMREIRLDEANRSVRSPGPGRFRYFDEVVTPDDPRRIERPEPPTRTSLAATWKEAMAYRQDPDGSRGRLDLDGDVRVRSTPDAQTSDRLDARSVSLDLVHGAGGVRADVEDGGLLANRGDTTIQRLVARGDAVLESRTWNDPTKAGDPRLFRVTGNLVDYRVDTGEATVDGEGGLLIHDPTPSPRRRLDGPVEAGFGVDGTTRFRWKRGMSMTREGEERYLVVMDEDVEVLHAGLEVDDQMTLTGRRLEVVVDRVSPAPDVRPARGSGGIELGGPAEILRVRGIGAVFVRTPEHDVECEEFDYNVDTGIAILRAAPGRVVTVQSKSANTPIRAERVQWDMRSGKLRILGGEGGVAR